MVPGGGFEPPTRGFSIRCSTPELPGLAAWGTRVIALLTRLVQSPLSSFCSTPAEGSAVAGFDLRLAARFARPHSLAGGFEIGQISVHYIGMLGRQHEMQAGRLLRHGCEPAAPVNLAIEREGMQVGMMKGDQAKDGLADDLETEPVQPGLQALARLTDLALQTAITFDAQIVHHRPCRRNRSAWTCAGQCRRFHRRTGPAGKVKRHEAVKILRPEQHG